MLLMRLLLRLLLLLAAASEAAIGLTSEAAVTVEAQLWRGLADDGSPTFPELELAELR
eukprot:COSAG06_NODE_6099_length_3110_cov_2.023580_1_plen_57_part_10